MFITLFFFKIGHVYFVLLQVLYTILEASSWPLLIIRTLLGFFLSLSVLLSKLPVPTGIIGVNRCGIPLRSKVTHSLSLTRNSSI